MIVGIIPARYGSTRFPGKPLADLDGKSVIKRVYEQASKAKTLDSVVVATDDKRIFKHVQAFGDAIMTSSRHKTGTERCFEAAKKMKLDDNDVVINIQGDEPLIKPQQIDQLARQFCKKVEIATLIKRITTNDELFNHHVVKVVVNTLAKYERSDAIYFSRSPIPHCNWKWDWITTHPYYKHIGIYGYRFVTLKDLVALPQSPLEKVESLEQLRWIEHGYSIAVKETKYSSISIDTPDDLERALYKLRG